MSQSARDALREFVGFERDVLHGNIGLCDQKSGILLAFSAAMVVYCLQALSGAADSAAGRGWQIAIHVLYLLGTAGFFLAAYFALRVIRPRLHRHANDYVFWESDLFLLSEPDFLSSISALDSEALEGAMRQHLHRLADICRRKFANMSYAIMCGEIAFLTVVAAELVRIFK